MPTRETKDTPAVAPAAPPPTGLPPRWLESIGHTLWLRLEPLKQLRDNAVRDFAESPLADPTTLAEFQAAIKIEVLGHSTLDPDSRAAAETLLDRWCEAAVPRRQAALEAARKAAEERQAAERRAVEQAERERLAAEQAERDEFARQLSLATEDERRRLLALRAEKERLEAARLAELEAQIEGLRRRRQPA